MYTRKSVFNYTLNPNLEIFLDRRTKYHRLPSDKDNRLWENEDLEYYREYYSEDRIPRYISRHCWRGRTIAAALALVVLFIFISYHGEDKPNPSPKQPSKETTTPHGNTKMKSLGGILKCDADDLMPSSEIPIDVNKLRAADIKIIAALGDSITVGARSKNDEEETRYIVYPGNSYISGVDEDLEHHITVANILRKFNPSIIGGSTGSSMSSTNFNVAVSGRKSDDLSRQALDLVQRIKDHPKARINEDWKLISVFIGTNDIGNLSSYKFEAAPIQRDEYKKYLEEAIHLLKSHIPRCVVSIIAMWNAQLAIEARDIIDTGKPRGTDDIIRQRRLLCKEYQKVAFEIQNEGKFEASDFTVVVQEFMKDISEPFRNKSGVYDTSFYADDIFHLSKYGNAVIGKWLWNGMFESVGKKTTKADLAYDDAPIVCPNKELPYIRTVKNSQ